MGSIILDGATGTMFQRNGMRPGEDSTQFALDHPEIVDKIQRMYVEAGSDAIYAPPFNLNMAHLSDIKEDL